LKVYPSVYVPQELPVKLSGWLSVSTSGVPGCACPSSQGPPLQPSTCSARCRTRKEFEWELRRLGLAIVTSILGSGKQPSVLMDRGLTEVTWMAGEEGGGTQRGKLATLKEMLGFLKRLRVRRQSDRDCPTWRPPGSWGPWEPPSP
jgi:hypothetical protein